MRFFVVESYMAAYFTFLRKQFQPVFFGWLLTFFSAFGQTFLISLFVPFLLVELDISKGAFGGYYAMATIIGAIFLLRFGHLIDEIRVRQFTNYVVIGLLISCILLALVWHPITLFLALTGLRLAGQGLMGHISMSVMSRHYMHDRGKALSLSSLGYSMSEMAFPAFIAFVIALTSWRWAAGSGAILLLLLLLLITQLDLERLDIPKSNASNVPRIGKRKFYWSLLKEKRFWIIALPSLSIGFVITGFFFYQFLLAEEMNWPYEIYTLLFTGYGAIRFVFSLFGGTLTDKFSALKLFPFFLIPMTIGVLSIGLLPGIWAGAAFLFLTGVTMGASGVLNTAVIAELYGTDQIGKVRSMFTVISVFSTAIAPLIFGILLDQLIPFTFMAYGCVVFLVVVIINSLRIRKFKRVDLTTQWK